MGNGVRSIRVLSSCLGRDALFHAYWSGIAFGEIHRLPPGRILTKGMAEVSLEMTSDTGLVFVVSDKSE